MLNDRDEMHVHDKIFVYGTLKTGHGANSWLQGRAEFVDEDSITGTLLNLGGFPGYQAEGSDTVMGEVWEIQAEELPAMLDQYEGYPRLYTRKRVSTNKGYTAWVYIYNEPHAKERYRLVEDGVW